jgi:phosphonate transport system permease protein
MRSIPDILAEDRALRVHRSLLWGGAVLLCAATIAGAMWSSPIQTENTAGIVWTLLSEMLPPDFSRLRHWAPEILATLGVSVAGTALGVAASVPLALLAAAETAPNRLVYHVARWLLGALRAIPELIWAVLLVAALGFGAVPGVIALALHSTGMVGKFFAETIEHADPQPIAFARATGARTIAIFVHVTLPLVLPRWMDVVVYRWEHNIRASTILGMVGAGGIGLELISALKLFDYRAVSALLLIIVVLVALCDRLGAAIRRVLR